MSAMDAAGAAALELPAAAPPLGPGIAGARAERGRGPAAALRVALAMLRMSFIEQRRYAFDAVVRLATNYAFFLVLFVGARATLGRSTAFGDSLGAIVVAMLVFMMAQRAYADHSGRLQAEATMGTLEQLAMSPVGLSRVLVLNMMAMMLVQLATNGVFLLMMMATTGRWLHLDLASIIPLLILTVISVHGLGLAMGGLALVLKRVGATTPIFGYIFLMLVAVPVSQAPFFKFLPLSWGAGLIRRVMVDEVSLYAMPIGDVLFLAGLSGAYFVAGLLVFRLCERVARERGLLGHY